MMQHIHFLEVQFKALRSIKQSPCAMLLGALNLKEVTVRNFSMAWAKAVVFAGYSGFHHQLRLPSDELGAI